MVRGLYKTPLNGARIIKTTIRWCAHARTPPWCRARVPIQRRRCSGLAHRLRRGARREPRAVRGVPAGQPGRRRAVLAARGLGPRGCWGPYSRVPARSAVYRVPRTALTTTLADRAPRISRCTAYRVPRKGPLLDPAYRAWGVPAGTIPDFTSILALLACLRRFGTLKKTRSPILQAF